MDKVRVVISAVLELCMLSRLPVVEEKTMELKAEAYRIFGDRISVVRPSQL